MDLVIFKAYSICWYKDSGSWELEDLLNQVVGMLGVFFQSSCLLFWSTPPQA